MLVYLHALNKKIVQWCCQSKGEANVRVALLVCVWPQHHLCYSHE